jgi:hypothetical protein
MSENISTKVDHNQMTMNARFADEIRAINSIFDEDTLIIISTCERSTAVSPKLQILDCRSELSFPEAYPDEPPWINGINPLWQMICSELKQRMKLLSLHLDRNSVPRRECSFELISTVDGCMTKNGLASKVVISPDLGAPEVQQKLLERPHLANMMALLKEANCAACMEHMLAVDMAEMPCDHFYCADCLQSKRHKSH